MGLFKKKKKEKVNNFDLVIDIYSDDDAINNTSNGPVQDSTDNISPKQSIVNSNVMFARSPTSSKKLTKEDKPKKSSKKIKAIKERHTEKLYDKPFGLNRRQISLENFPSRGESNTSLNSLPLNENLSKVGLDPEESFFQKKDTSLKIFNIEKNSTNSSSLENSDETSSSDEVIKKREMNVLKGKAVYKNAKSHQQRKGSSNTLQQENHIKKQSTARQSQIGIRQQDYRNIRLPKTQTPTNKVHQISQAQIRHAQTRFTPLQNQWSSETNLHKLRVPSVTRSVLSLPDSYHQDQDRELQINEMDKKKFKITVDVQGFSTDEIVIALKERRLVINAKHYFRTEFGFEFYQIHRSYPIPTGVQKSTIFTKISKAGILEINCMPETLIIATDEEFRYIGDGTYEAFVCCPEFLLANVQTRFENETSFVVYANLKNNLQSEEIINNELERIIKKYSLPDDADKNSALLIVRGDILQILLTKKISS